ncbi:MAG: hypothetical protein JWR88_1030 [Pseudonocardia sp.]|nr:hypothetical protein [Pseudonocardia sp.]
MSTLWEYTDTEGDRAELVDLGANMLTHPRYALEAGVESVWLPESARRSLRDTLTATLPAEAPAAPEPTPHADVPHGARISVTLQGAAYQSITRQVWLRMDDDSLVRIPPEAAVTVLAVPEPEPEPEPELLTADTELRYDMSVRLPSGALWTYDPAPDVWQFGQASLSTRRLIEAGAVIVR